MLHYFRKKKIAQVISQIYSGTYDPYWVNTLSLIHFDTFSGSAPIDEVPGNNWQNLSTPISTANKVFGVSSLDSSTSGGGVNTASAVNWNFGTGDYTIEFWFYNTSATDSYVFDTGVLGGTRGFLLNSGGGSTLRYTDIYGNGSACDFTFSKPSLNAWHHIAFVRRLGNVFVYIDGQNVALTGKTTSTVSLSYNGFTLGSYTSGSYPFRARYDEFRVSSIARYTSNFTVATSAFASGLVEPAFDPYWDQTILSVHGSSTDTTPTTFVDSSANKFALTRVGEVRQGGAAPFAGAGSIYFDGSGDYVNAPNSSAFAFGTGDFTVEFWVNSSVFQNYITIVSTRTGINSNCWSIGTQAAAQMLFYAGAEIVRDTAAMLANTWYHFAFVRANGVLTGYRNGVAFASVANTFDFTSTTLRFGSDVSYGEPFTGYLSNLHIVKGTAVYTGNFTPATSNLTAIANTSLLVKANTEVQENNHTFVDISPTSNGITRVGNVSQGTFGPHPTLGGSAYFDKTGDNLLIPYKSYFEPGAGDFTMEAWIRLDDVSGYKSICSFSTDFHLGMFVWNNRLCMFASSNGTSWNLAVGDAGTQNGRGTIDLVANVWYHVAYVRNGTTLTTYVNGVLDRQITGVSSAIITRADTNFQIGTWAALADSYRFKGYISNFNYVVGTALYTAPFTPNALPVTAHANSKLTLPFASYGIADVTRNTVLETVNGVAITSTNKKYGNTAISLSSGYLKAFGPALALGSGDFTIESWVYGSDTQTIVSSRGSAAIYDGLTFQVSGRALRILMFNGSGWAVAASSSTLLTSSVWNHVALVRCGTSVAMYLNGIRVYTGIMSGSIVQASRMFYIGVDADGGTTSTGMFDDLRITKYARYLNNFVPRMRSQAADFGPTYDPYWDKVVLRATLDGAHGATSSVDSTDKTISAVGGASLSTAVSKYGATSALSSGSGNYWTTPDSADYVLGSIFTIELWTYPTIWANGGNLYSSLIGQRPSNDVNSWYLHLSGGVSGVYGPAFEIRSGAGAILQSLTAASSALLPALNQWHHVAVTGDGSYLRLFLDGQLTVEVAQTASIGNTASALTIGGLPGTNEWSIGYIDDVRITKGVCRYRKNFAVPTAALPVTDALNVDANTVDPYWPLDSLVMPMTAIVDLKGASITQTGTVALSTATKKFVSSATFGTAGNYLSTPYDKTKYDWWTNDHTVEMWIYPRSHKDSSYNINQVLCIGNMSPTADNNYWSFGPNRNGKLTFYYWSGVTNSVVGSTTIALNQWTHIAMTHSGGIVRLFVNGALDATVTLAVTPLSGTEFNLVIGQMFGTAFDGQIEDLRITKGKARYTKSFAVPTTANPAFGVAV